MSLEEFFKDSVAQAMDREGVSADDLTAYYVANLLTLFARSEALYDSAGDGVGLKPLATMLADAAGAADARERDFTLQRIGDISLFVAGFFGDGFARRLVDIDYYICMGGSAYESLSKNVRGTARGRAFGAVFAELAEKFQRFVEVLANVRSEARASRDVDILRLYDVWLRTGSARAARLLRECGIEPNHALDAATRH